MRYNFLIPIIAWLPRKYEITIFTPARLLEELMQGWSGQIQRVVQVICDGTVLEDSNILAEVENGKIVSDWPESYSCALGKDPCWPSSGGYLEFGIRSVNRSPAFASKRLPGFYNLFVGDGVKPFVTCQTWKFGSPQMINQIATLKKYVDSYPVIHIDLDRDFGDSLVLINPYMKPVLAQILTDDGRTFPRKRIPPQTACRIDLAELVLGGQRRWLGQIQLTANNRLITQIVKHSAEYPDQLTTVEHLDPFRGDPTHLPAFRWFRNTFGDWLKAKIG